MELQIHRRVMRHLYDKAEPVYWVDYPFREYHEPMTIVLFDPAEKR